MKKHILIALFLLALDQITKVYALKLLSSPVPILGNILVFSLQFNTGIAFSIPIPQIITLILTFFIIVGGTILAYFSLPWKNKFYAYAFSCILGGALGNFIDRLVHQGVIDFIQVGSFPVFNFADMCISIGAFLVITYSLFEKHLEKPHSSAS